MTKRAKQGDYYNPWKTFAIEPRNGQLILVFFEDQEDISEATDGADYCWHAAGVWENGRVDLYQPGPFKTAKPMCWMPIDWPCEHWMNEINAREDIKPVSFVVLGKAPE